MPIFFQKNGAILNHCNLLELEQYFDLLLCVSFITNELKNSYVTIGLLTF